MAKEHIEILKKLKINIANRCYGDMFHFYLCCGLDEIGWDSDISEQAISDIRDAIGSIFRPLAQPRFSWEEYGIGAMLGDPLNLAVKAAANKFREEVIDALIEDFQDEEVGCTEVRT